MSHAELIQLGYQPDVPFADEKPKSLYLRSDFSNENAGTVTFDFSTKASHDDTDTVSGDGCFLYRITAKTA